MAFRVFILTPYSSKGGYAITHRTTHECLLEPAEVAECSGNRRLAESEPSRHPLLRGWRTVTVNRRGRLPPGDSGRQLPFAACPLCTEVRTVASL